jgi:hypothetical protein
MSAQFSAKVAEALERRALYALRLGSALGQTAHRPCARQLLHDFSRPVREVLVRQIARKANL